MAKEDYSHLYKTARWQKLRRSQLNEQPLCVKCQSEGRTAAATVADHIQPHRGDIELFHDPDNLQSLCKFHHDSWKKSVEMRGYSTEIGPEGFPIDPMHPSNR